MFSSTSTAFASDTDNTSVEDKNDEYLDLLGEIDAEIEGEFSDEFTIKSDIQVQIAHEITVRAAAFGERETGPTFNRFHRRRRLRIRRVSILRETRVVSSQAREGDCFED